MADSVNYLDWYYKANQDLQAAKLFFKATDSENGVDYAITAFHCQQCIEKYLKGHILKLTDELSGTTHNLTVLCNKAGKLDITFKNFIDDCAFVDEFYIEPRYPVDILFINKRDGEDCLNIATKIAEHVLELDNVAMLTDEQKQKREIALAEHNAKLAEGRKK